MKRIYDQIQEFDERFQDIQFDANGDAAVCEWKLGTSDKAEEVRAWIEDALWERDRIAKEETTKALGGCPHCRGKGYAIVKAVSPGHEDFGDIRYCYCDRGQQLASFTGRRHRINFEEI